ncbi:protein cordon-bleu isoform X4 [Ornithorhynchus anatinus]|uniref:protein cordon-bleu isoform X4 n=1 Tax=Ornithorhynchus anatinus TaxID=9258 RepID=UPI0010A7A99B|nr:protein cordon-bleu isoform X4 [Ornithorhynchus anatinus]
MNTPTALGAKPPTGRKMKARAPPPPGQPAARTVQSEQRTPRDVGNHPAQNLVNTKENLLDDSMDVTVILPSGLERKSAVNGRNAVMDLLIELCKQCHLNPAQHTIELFPLESDQPLSFKPNTLIGTLDVHTILLKEKVLEEKSKPPLPKMPEKSVRLVVNYLRTQKAVVRVSPAVPLLNILPLICAKCEVRPEHIILLRDNIAGEELELSKSLNELGIKELYAWDNKRVLQTKAQSEPSLIYQETTRKSSFGTDTEDREKKKFLGFFKVNKRSNKAGEQEVPSVDCDEGALKSATEISHNGCSTTPNTPSVNSRSMTLGPSLSLSNVSGMSVKSEMKKRRAPPPPSITPVSLNPEMIREQDKAAEKISQVSQNDFQKKKRHAPAPPTPLVPKRTEDKEENRKSTMGFGRQMPQKPPRGVPRGPPQLVLPPPPSYPPPDSDTLDLPVFPREADAAESIVLETKLSQALVHDNTYAVEDEVGMELSEVEETASVSSCFASEDTTEDSGVLSSPSDVVSLDSQNDGVKSKDKLASDQEEPADLDGTDAAEFCPQRSTSDESDDSGIINQRAYTRSEKAITAKNKEEGVFIPGQLQETLQELEEQAVEDNYETDINSESSSINGDSRSHVPNALVSEKEIPGTTEMELSRINTSNHKGNGEVAPFHVQEKSREVSADELQARKLTNKNNNAGSFKMEKVAGETTHVPRNVTRQPSSEKAVSRLLVKKREDIFQSYISSYELSKEKNRAPPDHCKSDTYSDEQRSGMVPSIFKTQTDDRSLKEKANQGHKPNSDKMSQKNKALISETEAAKTSHNEDESTSPTAWHHRGYNPKAGYELKSGLTTYKIVPPKPEMKCYDRGVSLSTGAIKIDDLGNLVSPHTVGMKNSFRSSVSETETQPIGKLKEFWRCNSLENQSGESSETLARKTAASKLNHTETEFKIEPGFSEPKFQPSQQTAYKRGESHTELEKTKPPNPVSPTQAKVPGTSAAKTTEFSFLKPQRRTSSQYVASAITRRIEPSKIKTESTGRHDKENSIEYGKPNPDLDPGTKKDVVGSKESPPNSQPLGKEKSPSDCHTGNWKESNRVTVSPQPGSGSHGANAKSLTRDDTAYLYGRSVGATLAKSFPRDNSFVEDDYRRSVGNKKTDFVCNQKCEKFNSRNLSPAPRSPNFQVESGPVSNSEKMAPVGSEPAVSLKQSSTRGAAGPNGLGVVKVEEKPDTPSADSLTESEIPLSTSIFGPKKKFKPVVQKPAPKDTSLHSALMEAIQSGGGKDKLRKTAEPLPDGSLKKPSYLEPESERSALLAAIRGHSGASRLKKVSSSASEELQNLRDAEVSGPTRDDFPKEGLHPPAQPVRPPPSPPALPSPGSTIFKAAPKSSPRNSGNPVDARQALLDAIRSGSGAARLKKVPLPV